MMHTVKTFDRGDHFCIVDTRSGARVYVKKGEDGQPIGPPLVQKVRNFAKAGAKHVAKGKPQASDAVVMTRWQICQACPLFRRVSDVQGECTHISCGCLLRPANKTGDNKLRWADQECPIGRWGVAL